MRYFVRIWESMSSSERIVAMSLVVGGSVAIVNSAVWAIATSFTSYQKARIELARVELEQMQLRLAGSVDELRETLSDVATDGMTMDEA